jgi:hypothetical protein
MRGYLCCIETEAEQKFIAKLANGRYLSLGATDEGDEGTWVWLNGAKWQYTCWMDGQPNNYGGNENYLATYDGGEWVDVAAEGQGFWMPTGFICELYRVRAAVCCGVRSLRFSRSAMSRAGLAPGPSPGPARAPPGRRRTSIRLTCRAGTSRLAPLNSIANRPWP